MKKLALTLLASFIGLQSSFAADPAFILDKKGKKTFAKSINADGSGNLTYQALKGKVKSKVKKGAYQYAWIPYTSTVLKKIDAAHKKGPSQKVADYYLKYAKTYKYLGWDIYCKYNAALCLDGTNQTDKAIALLEGIKASSVINPLMRPHLEQAQSILAGLYSKQGKTDKAAAMIPALVKSSNDDIAGTALVVQGDMLTAKGQDKDAVLSYLQTALLFPKENKAREEALYKAIKTMRKMNDAGRAKKFVDMIKKDYPKGSYTKKL